MPEATTSSRIAESVASLHRVAPPDPAGRLSSVRNAARVLKAFSRTDRELGVSQLARRLGLGVSTVHRLLATLADEGLLERGERGTYRLGLQMYELGVTVFPNLDLHEAALPGTGLPAGGDGGERADGGAGSARRGLRRAAGEPADRADLPPRRAPAAGARHQHREGSARAPPGGDPPGPTASTGSRRASPRTPSPTSACCSTSWAGSPSAGWAQNVEESALGAVSVAAPVRDDDGCRHRGDQRGRADLAGSADASAASSRGDRRRTRSSPRGSATGPGQDR